MVSRVSPWLLALGFLGLAIGAMVMPLGQEKVPPYAFLFDRNEAKNDQQRFLNAVVADSGVSRYEFPPPAAGRVRPKRAVPCPDLFGRFALIYGGLLYSSEEPSSAILSAPSRRARPTESRSISPRR